MHTIKGIAFGLLLGLLPIVVNGQSAKRGSQPEVNQTLPANSMLNGVYYYPEHWPKSRWDRDLERIASLGFTFTHFAEFAWDRLEPTDGQFQFGWLDTAISIAAKHKLKVILCTPSATPPAWLTVQYPEVLMVKQDGQSITHGARQHASWASERYQFYCKRLAEAMAKRYGDHPAVLGWQIDNEPSHYGRYDYSEANQNGFRQWLKDRYKSVDGLNGAWGTAFWSLTYTNWQQVSIPNPTTLVQQPNPHAMLDFSRYTAWSIAKFLDNQATALRQYANPKQWITTNYMGFAGHQHADPTLTKGLDFASITSYPACGGSGLAASGNEHFRLGDPYGFGFNLEHMRDAKGIVGMMELQPGQTNWGSFNPQPMPASISLWLWHTYALGSRFVCNYRFDQPTYGGELHYSAMTYPDGYTLRPTGQVWVNTMRVIDSVSRQKGRALQPVHQAKDVAILIAPESIWDLQHNKLTDQWSSIQHVMKFYTAVKRLGLSTALVNPDALADLNPKLVIVPAISVHKPAISKALITYAKRGGYVLVTPRTFVKDSCSQLLKTAFSEPLADLTGVKVLFNDMLPKTSVAEVMLDGKAYSFNNWAEVLAPYSKEATVQILGTYTNQFYKGSPAIALNRLGKGHVIYLGVDTDDGLLEQALVQKLMSMQGQQVSLLPEGVMLERRADQTIMLNYGQADFKYELPDKARLLYGRFPLKQGEVAVWQE